MNIEFSCANCGANLKVLKAFAGKTIQCPKCTKKTPVPGAQELPPPVAAKPAPASAAPMEPKVDGVYVSFSCANCASSLKVLKSFAGKAIQCPKCTKKTLVPDPGAKPGPAPAESDAPAAPVAASKPADAPVPKTIIPEAPKPEPIAAVKPPAPKPAAPAPKADAVSAARPTEDLQPRLNEQGQKLEALMRQMKDMELRLDVARLKAEKAEAEKQALAAQKEKDRAKIQDELSVHFKAEIEAARRTIVRLEEKVQDATQQRLVKASALDGRTAAQIEKELLENPDDALTESETAVPDAVMADIRESRFGRYVRASLMIHVVILAVTSLGLIKTYFVKPPEGVDEGGTNTVTTVSSPAASGEAAPAPVEAAPAATVPSETAPVEKPAGTAGTAPVKAKPIVPEEALPAPGEKPPSDTSVNLGL
jgi:DNA-directed RNA polymerase subunit RPC12/RpoP